MALSPYKLLRTPLDVLNILGVGGIRPGSFVVTYGEPRSGKTAFSYQTCAIFLQDNPDGIVHIFDVERSTDTIRLVHAFGVDMSRVIIHPKEGEGPLSLEKGFKLINEICLGKWEGECDKTIVTREELRIETYGLRKFSKLCQEWEVEWDKKDETRDAAIEELDKKGAVVKPGGIKPHFVIWDSISASKPEVELDAARRGENPMNVGGMGMASRIMELNLAMCNTYIFNKPVTVNFIAQMRAKLNDPTETQSFSHGNAFRHYAHYIINFDFIKKLQDEADGSANVGTLSRVKIEKSKFCPTTAALAITIDDRLGGRIVPLEEAPLVALELGLIKQKAAWYSLEEYENGKSFHWSEVIGNEKIRQICIEKLAHYYRSRYMTIDYSYMEENNKLGELTTEEKAKFWDGSNINLKDSNFILDPSDTK